MAGLNFQTQTIINSNLDPDSSSLGKDVVLFNVGEDGALNIKRDFHFYENTEENAGKCVVCAARMRKGYKAENCKATIDFAPVVDAMEEAGKTYFRLDIYLGVEGASPFIYGIQSPNEVLKGIPFWVEFTAKEGDDAAALAAKVVKLIKKNCVFQCDKDLIVVTDNEDGTITLEGATEYQRFKKIEISKFSAFDDYADAVASLAEEEGVTLDARGKNSFGTYSQIVKDLRLLTGANYQPYHIRQVETPIIGEIYDQYIVEVAGPAANDGLHFVGQRGVSNTMHVFWVKQGEVSDEFMAALGAVADVEVIEDAPSTDTPSEDTPVTPVDPDVEP